jgi:hypothetical protein
MHQGDGKPRGEGLDLGRLKLGRHERENPRN